MLMQVDLTDNHQNHLGSFFFIAFLKQHLRSNESEVGDCGGGGDYRNCVQLSAFQKLPRHSDHPGLESTDA